MHLGTRKSPLLETRTFIGTVKNTIVAQVNRGNVRESFVGVVKEHKADLLNDEGVATAIGKRFPETLIQVLGEVRSPLLQNNRFVKAVAKQILFSNIEKCLDVIKQHNRDVLNDEEFATSMVRKSFIGTVRVLGESRSPLLQTGTFVKTVVASVDIENVQKVFDIIKECNPHLLNDIELAKAIGKLLPKETIQVLGEIQSPLLQKSVPINEFLKTILPHAKDWDVPTILDVFKKCNPHLLSDEVVVVAMGRINPATTIQFLGEIRSPLLQNNMLVKAIAARAENWECLRILDVIESHNPDLLEDEEFMAPIRRLYPMQTARACESVRRPINRAGRFIGGLFSK
jgi:hypothetical protein